MDSFLDMGGYGVFVWPSFAVSAAVLVGLLVLSLRARNAAQADLDGLDAAEKDTSGEAQA